MLQSSARMTSEDLNHCFFFFYETLVCPSDGAESGTESAYFSRRHGGPVSIN